jgi:hypothetical protein
MATGDQVWHRWTGPGYSVRVNRKTDDAIREAYRLFHQVYPDVPSPGLSQGGMFGLGEGADASAGTHNGGGVADFIVKGMSRLQILYFVTCLRWVGFAAWFRPFVKDLWPDHIHAVRIGDTSLAKGAYDQTVDFKNGLTGLASDRKDTLHQWVGWTTWEQYSKGTEFFEMTAKHYFTRKETIINVGVETLLPIADNGNVSLLSGPLPDFYAGVNIRIANLPSGEVLRLYLSHWDYKAGVPSEMVAKGLQVEIPGSGGSTYFATAFDGEIEKSARSGWQRRIRLLAETDSRGVVLPDAQGIENISPVTVTRLAVTTRK